MEESYEINYIAVKGGSIKIRYSVSPAGGVPEENIVSRSDKPHEDFQRAWSKLANLFRKKNKQYGDKDQLANFRNGAMLQYGDDSWEHMYETAKSYCLKHVAHVFGAGQTIDEEKISESLGDIAVYCIIMQYMVESNKQAAEKTKENDHE